ncbi:MAG: rhomboid family intramembrane serine protease [Candidatus Thiodiazotropha sp.]
MLILPLHRKLDRENLPIVTLLLIAANIAIFLMFQLDDDRQLDDALNNYRESGLYRIERPGYLHYLDETNDPAYLTGQHETGDDESDLLSQMIGIQWDPVFLGRLHDGKVIKPGDKGYDAWRKLRGHFESLYEGVTFIGYGLRTGEPTLVSLFTHMFLHSGFGHLFGNMLFLFALGVLIENLMGRLAFAALYLLGGLGSAGFDILFASPSLIPGIGASGAIAGLMGMTSVIYGLRRIRFFYSLGVYFDYVALPAIILLPLWIGNELFQLLAYPDSHINYLAHLGGLVSGAALAALLKYTLAPFDLSYLEQEAQSREQEERLAQARSLYRDMEYRKALPLLRRLHQEGCQDREARYLYYQCSRLAPESEDFHKAARSIFSIPERDRASAELILEVYREYVKIARPGPKFNADTLCRLAECFVGQKWRAEADKLISILQKKGVQCGEGKRLQMRYDELRREHGGG